MLSKWNYLPLTSEEQKLETALNGRFSDTPTISELLIQRGLNSDEDIDKFFNPSLNDLHDPFLMPDMDKAVSRLNKAMGKKERIMVYGDYDVDGITSVAMVYKYLRNYYSNIEYYIPTRYEEGYGISLKSIDYAQEQGVKLIIVLDCGIKAIEEIRYAKERGIDFIICDHHVSDDELPQAYAILNPKLVGSSYPFAHLSGCGVGFKLLHAFAISNELTDNNELYSLLDLVAISIAADIVPMIGENRILTYFGLKRINANPSIGIRSILRIANISTGNINISDLIFKIGPRINASGRMQTGMEAVELLISKDIAEANELCKSIDQYNKDRKELDKRITEEANALIEGQSELDSSKRTIVLYNSDWHKGIIGIVASRITELYYKPSVVLTLSEDGLATGSSRSVQGYDIYAAVEDSRELLENFGGHTYAVGLTLKQENIEEFTQRFEKYVSRTIQSDQLTPHLNIDAYINFEDITPNLVNELNKFNPFGPGNSKPVFCTRCVYDSGNSKLVGHNMEHIKLELTDTVSDNVINGIAFNMAKHFDYITAQNRFDICYTIEQNRRGKNRTIQLLIKEIRTP